MTKPVAGKSIGGKSIPKVKPTKCDKKNKNVAKKSIDSKGKNLTDSDGMASPPIKSSSSCKLWSFHQEIAGMMYAFGDCRKPSHESVSLVEDIVHQQMTSVLVQAAEVTNTRGGKFTSIDDILFILKNNKCKLQRVIRYLRLKDLKSKTIKSASPDEEDIFETIAGDNIKGDSGKRLKMAFDFLSSIDDNGDLISLFDEEDIFDEIKQARQKRADRMSKCLDTQAYMDFAEARQMSFAKKIGKFKDWLGIGSGTDTKTSTAVVEILSYLAYETVNEIVDLALLAKEDCERMNLISKVLPVSINPLSEHALYSTAKHPCIPKGALPTPTQSPPETPTSSISSNEGLVNLTSPIQGGLASSLGTASLASSLSSLAKTPKSKKKKVKNFSNSNTELNSQRIQPLHIREAVRRYTMSKYPITPFYGFSRPTLSHKTLCL
ncbi:transcription initiation protein SPT3 homolog isoform X2 [Hydra vulgaris]|uniref:Transcription initiation protein SPT3 homolog isoform X2 n=1 Tax=Hydra vulgaris TaxID=6087 RepID=A0ABM4BH64_HYDVU